MSRPGPLSERAVILAPQGRDAEVAVMILKEAGFPANIASNLAELCDEIASGAGLAIMTDQAIHEVDLRPLVAWLKSQPPWSDFPIVLLTRHGGGVERNPTALRLADVLGNVIFVERPFHPTTLTSVVQTAVRSRRRQYEARSRLKELREGERRLQTALKAGRLGSWVMDVDSMTLRASAACKSHFGRSAEDEFTYEMLLATVHPEDRARMADAVARTLRTGHDYVIEYRNAWSDGSVHWVDMRARALKSDAGEVNQLVGVSSDITGRKQDELERERLLSELAKERAALSELTETLEQRVRERTGELMSEVAARERAQEQLLQSQKMESIGQLTGGVAHDFNNLLMAVMGNLDLLRKRYPDDTRAQRLIGGAMEGAKRGTALTQRMLAFARRQDLKTSSADLATLLHGMEELLDRSLGPRIELAFDLADDLPPAKVDANQIELAILNLAINARDAMPEGGTIRIKLDRAAPAAEGRLRDPEYLRLQLSDTGSGMDEATLKRAIEPFFSTKELGKGTGLGLSMVHGLAVQLGGRLELKSTEGKGTTAILWLPIANEQPVEAPMTEPNPEPSRTATILVVDDDPLVAMSTVDMLEDLGHKVIEANSADQALRILDAGKEIDLLLTDQAMPGMTGVELAKIARRKRPLLPILLATGYTDLPAGQKIDLPRLSKPYMQTELRDQIDRLLRAAAAE